MFCSCIRLSSFVEAIESVLRNVWIGRKGTLCRREVRIMSVDDGREFRREIRCGRSLKECGRQG